MARKTHGEDWWANHPEVVRCVATMRSVGDQCRSEAYPGATVCYKHGGNVRHVQEAAARRIQTSVEDAVKRLQSMLDDPAVEAREKIKILHDLLDRGGLAPTSKHLVGVVTDEDPIDVLFRSILTDPNGTYDPSTVQVQVDPEVLELNRRADPQALIEAGEYDDDEDLIGDIVDAELIEPEPAPRKLEKATQAKPIRVSVKPPKHIRDDLERLGLL